MLARNTILKERYRIVRPLGRGGMGQVYEAIDDDFDSIVAIKETLVTSEELRNAFRLEGKILANLKHRALPRVTHHFFQDDGQFLVMEFIDGLNLSQRLELRGRPFDYADVLTWTNELLDVLAYLHRQEPQPIIHRDIKPANIKVTNEGDVYLLDFGLAKGAPGQVGSSLHAFTMPYASLEQLHNSGTTAQSDIYSLGATLYHLLTGDVPIPASHRFESLEDSGRDPLVPAHEINPAVPTWLSEVISKSMAIRRRDRFGSVQEMRQALEAAQQKETEAETQPFPPKPVPRPQPEDKRLEKKQEAVPPQKTIPAPHIPQPPPPAPQLHAPTPAPFVLDKQRLSLGTTIMIVLRVGAGLIALLDFVALLNWSSRDWQGVHVVLGMILGGTVASVLAWFLNRSVYRWLLLTFFFPWLALAVLAFMPTFKRTSLAETIENLRKTIELDPSSAVSRYNLGLAYLYAHNRTGAIEQYEALRNLKSDNADELLTRIKGLESGVAKIGPLQPSANQVPKVETTPAVELSRKQKSKRAAVAVVAVIAIFSMAAIGILVWTLRLDLQSNGGQRTIQRDGTEAMLSAPTAPPGMVYVPSGRFVVGRDDGDEYEKPAYTVGVEPFFIDIHEVTRQQYQDFVLKTGRAAPPNWRKKQFPNGTGNWPVTGVDWDDANAYALWANKRLPTEYEWELAARGTDGRRYPWGNDWKSDLANANSAKSDVTNVGAFKGTSPFGVLDMVGNAWEWTANSLAAYPGGQLPTKPTEETIAVYDTETRQMVQRRGLVDMRVIRGGAYDSDQNTATTTYRRGYPARGNYDYSKTGFRCAKDSD